MSEGRGEVADACGDYAVALGHLQESLAISRELGSQSPAAYALHKLGRVAQHQGRWSAAAAHYAESLKFWRHDENPPGIALCLEGLASVAHDQGGPERAARLLGEAAALRERRRIPLPPVERTDLDRVTAGVRNALGDAAFAATWATGEAAPIA
jgi:tetratricopeptide (TPR) repeat protein